MRTLLPLLAATALTVAGCSTGTNNTADASNVADTLPEGPSLASRLFGGGKPVAVDAQGQSENGAVFQVTSIQAKPTETVVGIKVVNGANEDIKLQWSSQKTFLAAGGEKLYLSTPVDNRDMKIAEGATMEGELVFLGRLPQASSVNLTFNDGWNDNKFSSNPAITIPIALPPGAYSDDGSKKN